PPPSPPTARPPPPTLFPYTTLFRSQLAHQRKRHARFKHLVLALALVGLVGGDALALEQRVAVLQVEQRARGDRDGQWIRERSDGDRKSTRLNSSHVKISYAVFCLKK